MGAVRGEHRHPIGGRGRGRRLDRQPGRGRVESENAGGDREQVGEFVGGEVGRRTAADRGPREPDLTQRRPDLLGLHP